MCEYGDIYIAELGMDSKGILQSEGSLQNGVRPIIVISNNKANRYSPVISIIPMTTSKKKRNLPTHVFIKDCGLSCPSIVLAEQITSLNQSRLKRKIGSIRGTVYEEKVKKAIGIQLNL